MKSSVVNNTTILLVVFDHKQFCQFFLISTNSFNLINSLFFSLAEKWSHGKRSQSEEEKT